MADDLDPAAVERAIMAVRKVLARAAFTSDVDMPGDLARAALTAARAGEALVDAEDREEQAIRAGLDAIVRHWPDVLDECRGDTEPECESGDDCVRDVVASVLAARQPAPTVSAVQAQTVSADLRTALFDVIDQYGPDDLGYTETWLLVDRLADRVREVTP